MCFKQPCDGRCPYAAEGDVVHHCQMCDESVRVGEYYIEMGGEFYHLRCLETIDLSDWLSLVDAAAELAEA